MSMPPSWMLVKSERYSIEKFKEVLQSVWKGSLLCLGQTPTDMYVKEIELMDRYGVKERNDNSSGICKKDGNGC